MTETYDAVIVGAGHNGLVCASYLARAGQSVLVLERRSVVGGCAVTEEFAPGFRCSATFPGVETFDPSITRELELESHGLRLLEPGGILIPRSGADACFLPPFEGPVSASEWAESTGFSATEAASFVEFDAFLRRLAEAFGAILAKPLPRLDPQGLSGIMQLLGTGWLMRRLGATDLREAMRFLPMPLTDVVDERFETDALKAAVAVGGITGSWLGPRSPGSALNLLLHRLGGCRGALGTPRFAVGGTGGLTDALRAGAEAVGVAVRTEAEVTRIRCGKRGVVGVELASSEEIKARRVISSADPRRTLLQLVEPSQLDPPFQHAVHSIRSRGTVAIVKLALDALPRFVGVEDDSKYLAGRIQIGSTVDALERAFDDTKYGRLPRRPYLDLTLPSISDPSLAPEGKHVMSAWVQFPPYHLRGRTWDEARDELAETVVKRIEERAPDFGSSIVARDVLSPLDIEQRFGATEGHLYHVEPALDQCLYMRPVPGWARYRMPIRNLYLCGSGTHGGGGLTGLAGRNAARRILAEG